MELTGRKNVSSLAWEHLEPPQEELESHWGEECLDFPPELDSSASPPRLKKQQLCFPLNISHHTGHIYLPYKKPSLNSSFVTSDMQTMSYTWWFILFFFYFLSPYPTSLTCRLVLQLSVDKIEITVCYHYVCMRSKNISFFQKQAHSG